MTVLEVIQRSSEFLAKKGVESPRLQAELLLAHVLELPRMQLYLKFERELSPAELQRARELVRRRGQREPLQLITGSTSFCGLEIAVNRHTLIPRPETELLAEQGWQFLNSLGSSEAQPPTALDFGTGSGCVAIALAVKCPVAQVCAVDVSAKALHLAGENVARHGVSERVRLCQGDGFTAVHPAARFDLIIGNPPYIPTAEIDKLEPEVQHHDPRPALDGGPDGLDFYRRLAAETGE
jgi:release factor glutamine methyltransferase